MAGFGRAFLPILTRQEGRKAEGRREKGEGRREKGEGRRVLKKTSGSLPKACRDWRIKSIIILFFLAKMTKNAQKGYPGERTSVR